LINLAENAASAFEFEAFTPEDTVAEYEAKG
jgi:hypothetical protein